MRRRCDSTSTLLGDGTRRPDRRGEPPGRGLRPGGQPAPDPDADRGRPERELAPGASGLAAQRRDPGRGARAAGPRGRAALRNRAPSRGRLRAAGPAHHRHGLPHSPIAARHARDAARPNPGGRPDSRCGVTDKRGAIPRYVLVQES